mmetsp:Transcript_22918/g.35265  ORF Transcript_22918/g.35265 Transcript_22918/m.35265 type:complete len:88 (+) Transcript_22918:892-1155(+)|eukprot:CAMPEP_0170500158 /NCGR_PEP_ID=MMETSP0208-20121228/33920_1 /TAXON_ID=197538 /ORGANISM="Strombidium inclinatum, Strain S3" /LENGTH=87 /DNA_ID=CAMNT_0010778065 /DNA_START=822 /DNA_END=1085 /DNA_ORIENTATION=+
MKKKKRPSTASKASRGAVTTYGVSKYSNPGERPQFKNSGKVNRDQIFTKLSANSPAVLNALGFDPKSGKKKKVTQFEEKMNKPVIMG